MVIVHSFLSLSSFFSPSAGLEASSSLVEADLVAVSSSASSPSAVGSSASGSNFVAWAAASFSS